MRKRTSNYYLLLHHNDLSEYNCTIPDTATITQAKKIARQFMKNRKIKIAILQKNNLETDNIIYMRDVEQ